MANSIDKVTKFLPIIDEVYSREVTSAVLEKPQFVQYVDGANAIKLMKLSTQALGDYSRANGYASGNITATWETHTLSYDRGRKFILDKMDNEETLGLTLGATMKEFMRVDVAKELDAFRYAKLASLAGLEVAAAATLTSSTAAQALDLAIATMKEEEVPLDGAKIFVTPTVKMFVGQSSNYVKNVNGTLPNGRSIMFDTYEGLQVVEVPQTRFYTAITLLDGTTSGETEGGFIKSVTSGNVGVDLNFMIVADNACLPVVKHNPSDLIDGSKDSGDYDAWVMKYRLYHDLFVPDNKTKGIYTHFKAT